MADLSAQYPITIQADGRWLEYDGEKWVEPLWSYLRYQAELRRRRYAEMKRIEHNRRQKELYHYKRGLRKIIEPVEHNEGCASWTPTMSILLAWNGDVDE